MQIIGILVVILGWVISISGIVLVLAIIGIYASGFATLQTYLSDNANQPDIRARIKFFGTSEGGRRSPVSSGYRPNHNFGDSETFMGAEHWYLDTESVAPGETVIADLGFFAPETLIGSLKIGTEFTVNEGKRIIGSGVVLQIVNPALKNAR